MAIAPNPNYESPPIIPQQPQATGWQGVGNILKTLDPATQENLRKQMMAMPAGNNARYGFMVQQLSQLAPQQAAFLPKTGQEPFDWASWNKARQQPTQTPPTMPPVDTGGGAETVPPVPPKPGMAVGAAGGGGGGMTAFPPVNATVPPATMPPIGVPNPRPSPGMIGALPPTPQGVPSGVGPGPMTASLPPVPEPTTVPGGVGPGPSTAQIPPPRPSRPPKVYRGKWRSPEARQRRRAARAGTPPTPAGPQPTIPDAGQTQMPGRNPRVPRKQFDRDGGGYSY